MMFQGGGSDGIYSWNGNDGAFSEDQLYNNHLFHSTTSQNNVFPGASSSQQPFLNQQLMDVDSSEESSPLGLKLKKSPSFVKLVEMKLSQARQSTQNQKQNKNHGSDRDSPPPQPKTDKFVSQPASEKLKASNFPATYLKIGTWERFSRNEANLVAKCYFAKRKLVWEILEGALKSKIEMQWSDIVGIRAKIRDNEPGVLEIELNQPPAFFREINPQPRKHTLWHQAPDFTGGQAPICRRHFAVFNPGLLDKHYEKLLQCDPRLMMLSKNSFPTHESLYFQLNIYGSTCFPFNFNGSVPEFAPGLHVPNFSTPLSVAPHQFQNFKPGPLLGIKDSNSPMSVMDSSHMDSPHQRAGVWSRGLNNTPNNFQVNPRFPCQDYQFMNNVVDPNPGPNPNPNPNPNPDPNSEISLIEIERLLDASQDVYSNEISLLENVNPMIDPNNNMMMMMMMNPIGNNSPYPYVFSEPTMEDFAALDATQGNRHWT